MRYKTSTTLDPYKGNICHVPPSYSSCDTCHGNGYLSARATIQVVPVVDLPPKTRPKSAAVWSAPNAPHALLMRYQPITDREWSMECQLPLDPLPVPGRDWVVVFNKVAS